MMDDYGGFAELAKEAGEGAKDDPTDMDAEEVCNLAIDAALNGCGSSEDRREAFKRAVLMVVKEYG